MLAVDGGVRCVFKRSERNVIMRKIEKSAGFCGEGSFWVRLLYVKGRLLDYSPKKRGLPLEVTGAELNNRGVFGRKVELGLV